jgi:hypothetical protein
LSLTATAILTAYQIKKKRGDDQGKASGKANTAHAQYFDRGQADAYAKFAKRATAPVHDDFGDSEIPF